MLLDGAIRQAGGDLSNKDSLRAALRAAKFNSVRGTFRFNRNHFPIQDWYVREVVDDGDGTKSSTLEKIFTAAEDRFADQCGMK
jgi:branched-chain amino acid transport system substrate-binding protein